MNIISCTSQTQADRIARLRFDFELADPGHLALDPPRGQAGRLGLRGDPRAPRRPDLSRGPAGSRAQISGVPGPTRFRTRAGTPTFTACSGLLGRDSARAGPGSLASSGGTGSTRTRGSPSSRSSSRPRCCSSRSSPRPACSRRAPACRVTPASGWSPPSSRRRRSRRSAARPPTPLAFTTAGRPRPDRHDPDRQRPEVHAHPGHAVGQPDRRPRARATAAAPAATPILQVTRVGHVAGRRCDRAGPVDDRARAAGRRVLGGDRLDRREGAQRGRPARASTRAVSITGPMNADAEHDRRGLRVLRVPHARHVHRDGHRRHRRRRPGGARPEPDDVGDGRPDVVAARSTTTPRRRSRSPAGRASTGDARHQHPDRHRQHELAAVRPVLVRSPGTTTLTPLFPYPSGYTVFAGNCTDNNPIGLDTTRNRFYNNPGTIAGHGHARAARSTTTVPLYDLPVTVMNGAGVRSSARRSPPPRRPGTRTRAADHRGVHHRRRRRAPLPTLGLVTTGAGGTSTTAMPLGHWTITATVGHQARHASRSGAGSPACSTSRPPARRRGAALATVTVPVS